jgi:hypothetical protein
VTLFPARRKGAGEADFVARGHAVTVRLLNHPIKKPLVEYTAQFARGARSLPMENGETCALVSDPERRSSATLRGPRFRMREAASRSSRYPPCAPSRGRSFWLNRRFLFRGSTRSTGKTGARIWTPAGAKRAPCLL